MILEKRKYLYGILLLFFIFFIASLVHTVHNNSLAGVSSGAQNQTALVASAGVPLPANTYPVVRVIDGDTIIVNMLGVEKRVRMIGVNTPETVDPRKPVQCFGVEASQYVKKLLPIGTPVRLEIDPTQNDTDKYGRLLRYVYMGDVLVDEEIIQEGYGYEYTYNTPYQFQSEFKASQQYAREGRIGLWSPDTCNGKLKI